MLKHKTSCSFPGLATARVEINSIRGLPLIAQAWLHHWSKVNAVQDTVYVALWRETPAQYPCSVGSILSRSGLEEAL